MKTRFAPRRAAPRLCLLLVALTFLSGCRAIPAASQGPTPTFTAEPLVVSTTPSPTIALAATRTASPTAPAIPTRKPTAAPVSAREEQRLLPDSPINFVFPTPLPAPESAWRPPLYPVPWSPTPVDHFYFARPIAADQVNWPLADYRYGGVFFDDVVHTGVDIPAPKGTPVIAAGEGKVTWAGYGLYVLREDAGDPYGLAVAIRHDFGYAGETLYTVYGHMDQIFVERGQHVKAGELIGLVGETGKVTGPHLHFEVRIGKNNYFGSRNPELWMAPPQGWGLLVARIMSTNGAPLESHEVKIHSYDTDQYWVVKTYGHGSTNSDPYYRENMVIGDLPAGKYEVWVPFAGTLYNLDIEIRPGMISYFTFRGRNGFHTNLPPLPGADFVPPSP